MPTKLFLACIACLFLFTAQQATAQGSFDGQVKPESFCNAPVIEKNAEPEIVKRIKAKMAPQLPPSEHIRLVLVQSNVVNAFTHRISEDDSVICLPTATVALFSDSEAELAFLIGHEVGHAVDNQCKSSAGRFAVTHTQNRIVQQRACELRADEIGFTLLRKAGYSPFAAAGMFGRLEMVTGKVQTGLLAHFEEGAHPITPDRITHLRKLMLEDASTAALKP